MSKTTYRKGTPKPVKDALDACIESENLSRIWYGDTKTGEADLEDWMVLGRIGRTTGNHSPIMIDLDYSDGYGGDLISTDRIVRIDSETSPRRWETLYQHPKFHLPELHLHGYYPKGSPEINDAWCNPATKEYFGYSRTVKEAWLWLAFMDGTLHERFYLSQAERDQIKADALKPYDGDEDDE